VQSRISWNYDRPGRGRNGWTDRRKMMAGTTAHAQQRCTQRNLSPEAVDYVLANGAAIDRTGITFYVLRERDLPPAHRRADAVAKLVGTTLLVARDGTLITAYRRPDAYRHACKKGAYQRRKNRSQGQDPSYALRAAW